LLAKNKKIYKGDGEMQKRLYSIWHNMKTRCYNPKAEHFKYYGGRGISVCEAWRNSFNAFYLWAISHGYASNLTLDRIDGNGNYEPSNCHWADMHFQNNHTKKNHYITHNGETKTAAEWAKQYGIHRSVLNNRIRRGWTFEKAVAEKVRHPRKT
jgi:hypothetical protein